MNKSDKNARLLAVTIDEWIQMAEAGIGVTAKVIPHGNSMWPLIRSDRDMVEIEPVRRELKIGDVVVFRSSDGRAVIHRIYRITEDEVQTYGDNCSGPDAPVKKSEVFGIAVRVRKGLISYDPNRTAGLAGVLRFSTKGIRRIRKKIKNGMISE